MIERESKFLAVAHRKMDRVIVFHRLVTKTTPRRHKKNGSLLVLRQVKSSSGGRNIDRNLCGCDSGDGNFPHFFSQTKTTYQQNFYIIEIFG